MGTERLGMNGAECAVGWCAGFLLECVEGVTKREHVLQRRESRGFSRAPSASATNEELRERLLALHVRFYGHGSVGRNVPATAGQNRRAGTREIVAEGSASGRLEPPLAASNARMDRCGLFRLAGAWTLLAASC